MKIYFIHMIDNFNGSYTNFEDTYFNIKRFYPNDDVKFFIFYANKSTLIRYNQYFINDKNIFFIPLGKNNNIHIEADVFFISKEILALIINDNKYVLSSQKTFLLYPAFVYTEDSDYELLSKMIKYINKNHIRVICNKFNSKYCDNNMIWYMKFNMDRIYHIHSTFENDDLTSEFYNQSKILNVNINPFSYSTYHYNRYDKLVHNTYKDDNARYFENIGKLQFEFILLYKKAFYSSKNKIIDDGLTEYMSLLGLDDNNDYCLNDIPYRKFYSTFKMNKGDFLIYEITR